MKIFISSEADASIASEFNWIDKEIEKPLEEFVREKDYGESINNIALIPIILPVSFFAVNPEYKERRLIKHKQKEADYRLYIDYEKFVNSSKNEKAKLLINTFIEAIRDIGNKINDKDKFDSEKLEIDVKTIFKDTLD